MKTIRNSLIWNLTIFAIFEILWGVMCARVSEVTNANELLLQIVKNVILIFFAVMTIPSFVTHDIKLCYKKWKIYEELTREKKLRIRQLRENEERELSARQIRNRHLMTKKLHELGQKIDSGDYFAMIDD